MHHIKYEKFSQNDVLVCGSVFKDAQHRRVMNVLTTASLVCAAAGVKVLKMCTSNSLMTINALNIEPSKTFDAAQHDLLCKGLSFLFSENAENTTVTFSNRMLLSVENVDFENLVSLIKNLKPAHVMIVSAKEPVIDEISVCSSTRVFEIKDGEEKYYEILPEKFGIKRAEISALRGATPVYNANLSKEILSGKIKDAKLDAVALNAGAMFYVAGVTKSILDGIIKAYNTVNSGLALEKLNSLQK